MMDHREPHTPVRRPPIPFAPTFCGELDLGTAPPDMTARIARRVREGLLVPGLRRRANYRVVSETRDAIRFRAEDFLTSAAVGLNEVTVRVVRAGVLEYEVRFWRWALYCLFLCGGIMSLVFLVSRIPSLARMPGGGQLPLWGLLPGVVFPWLLVAFHKPRVDALLRTILTEVARERDAQMRAG